MFFYIYFGIDISLLNFCYIFIESIKYKIFYIIFIGKDLKAVTKHLFFFEKIIHIGLFI